MEAGLGKYAFHGTSPRDLTSPPGVGNLLPMSNEYYAPGEQRAEVSDAERAAKKAKRAAKANK